MGFRIGLVYLLLVGATWHCDARTLVSFDSEISLLDQENNIEGNAKVCRLCESFVAKAIEYLAEKKTQTEITAALRRTCSMLGPVKQECNNLVDSYVPLFFAELSSIEPENFCRSIHLCEQITLVSSQIQENGCGFCRQTVSDVLDKLKDPHTQIEIMETLLKTCNSMGSPVKERCKRLVFEYGPLILAYAQTFLETADICSAIHACAPHEATLSAADS